MINILACLFFRISSIGITAFFVSAVSGAMVLFFHGMLIQMITQTIPTSPGITKLHRQPREAEI
jgi:hypothetical protein